MISRIQVITICLDQTRYTSDALDTVKEQVEEVVKGVKEAIKGLVEEMKTVIKETEEGYKKHKGDKGKDEVERIIEKAV